MVRVNTNLPAEEIVPIGWVAVGDPATILPPDRHEEIWEIQRELDFPGTAFWLARETPDLIAAAGRRYAALFGSHRADRTLAEPPPG